ncbi:MAG: hypothetical protein KatS3mg111_0118 [Pirellulaceae bacterium]|nr:MAG: hypothetical protein KatS3mg111_0118 [Pirellulaceae bacterium]
MSVTTDVHLYSIDPSLNLAAAADALQRICGLEGRTVDRVHFSRPLLRAENAIWTDIINAIDGNEEDLGYIDADFLKRGDLARFARQYPCVTVDADFCPISERFASIQKKCVDSKVRGDIILDLFTLSIGMHTLVFDPDISEKPQWANISLTFWSYSTPPDGREFERQLLNCPQFHALKTELEHAVGTLNVMVYQG